MSSVYCVHWHGGVVGVIHIQDEEKRTENAVLGCSGKEADLFGKACSSLGLNGFILQE